MYFKCTVTVLVGSRKVFGWGAVYKIPGEKHGLILFQVAVIKNSTVVTSESI